MSTVIDKSCAPQDRARRRRPSPEARRLEILEAAAQVFLEHGYEAGAMSDVARRLGGSKETLYRYFATKQALFAAVVQEGADRHGRRVFSEVHESGDLASDLSRLGRALLTFVTSEEHIALRRAVIAEAGKSDLGKIFFEHGRRTALEPVAALLGRAMQQGRLRRADPWTAAMHFRGLCQSGLYDLRLEGVVADIASGEIVRAADEAVDVFLRAYAVRG